MFALVDGNNFYASCEMVFRPSLKGLPLVILSNNDGCCVARSNEAKALGIKMGAPYFQVKHFAESHGLVALSANFGLYGDMSDRMMSLAAGMGATSEIYSIDEVFVGLDGVRGDLVERGHKIRSRILQWVGIPCGVGIAQTKTLAKLANHISKSAERKPGSYPAHLAQVCNLASLTEAEKSSVFEATEVGEVWGIGRKISKQLSDGGIKTVQDLVVMDLATIKRGWSVVLERTVRELHGIPCIELDDAPAARKEIAVTRSFGQAVTDLADLGQAVTTFASRASEKVRKQGSLAGQVLVFIRTSPFRDDQQYSRSIVVPLRRPTADTGAVVQAAMLGLQSIFRPGFKYAKAGVMLLDLNSDLPEHQQGELDLDGDMPAGLQEEKMRLMSALDAVNQRYGKGTLKIGSAGFDGSRSVWAMKQERRTPGYTTCIEEIAVARA